MKNRLIATVLVALSLGVVNTEGWVPPLEELPDELPMIGSRAKMCHWAATNRNCTLSTKITFTNTNNQQVTWGHVAITDGSRFNSYADYKYAVMTNGIGLYNRYRSSMSSASTIKFTVGLYYVNLNASGMHTETNLGPMSLITSNHFLNVEPIFVQSVVPLTNFPWFGIEVQLDNGTYQYNWTPRTGGVTKGFNPPTVFPPECTTTNLIIFNEWYSTNAWRARFAIGAASKTNRYTQCGDWITGKPLIMKRDRIEIFMPRGVDAILQSSPDFNTWTTVTNLPFSLGTNRVVVPIAINKNTPRLLYRTSMW